MKFDVTSPPSSTSSNSIPKSLRIFMAVDIALLALAGITEAICHFMLRLGFPYKSPLLFEYFPDIVLMRPRYQHFHTLEFFTDAKDMPCMYPAPVSVLYRLLFFFIPHDLSVFLLFILLCFVLAAILFGRALIRNGLGRMPTILLLTFLLLTSYPLWFEIKQANMEICVWVLVTAGVWRFFRGRGYSAAACFGAAGAMKIFPFLYLALLLGRRQYRQILFSFLVAVAITVPSLWLVYPHVLESWRLTSASVSNFAQVVTLHIYPQMSFDHSIFGFFKTFFYTLLTPHQLSRALTLYLACAVVFVLLAYFLRIRKLPVINQVLCLCVLSILLPPTSFDYTLTHLYIPWALLVLLAVSARGLPTATPGLVPALVCFAILFVPETEIILHGYSYAGQIKALTLAALFFIGFRYPFLSLKDRALHDLPPAQVWIEASPHNTA